MLKLLATLTILATTLALPLSSQAEVILFQAKAKGRDLNIKLDPTMIGKTIGVYVASTNPDAQTLDIGVKGFGGEVISAEGFTTLGKEKATAAALRGTNPLLLTKDSKYVKQVKIPRAGESASSSSSSSGGSSSSVDLNDTTRDANCGCLTPSQIQEALEAYKVIVPGITTEQFCAFLPVLPTGCGPLSGGGGSTSSTSPPLGNGGEFTSEVSVLTGAFVPYNRCLPKALPGALVKIDLAGVDASVFNGGELTVAARLRPYKGGKRATIKPVSDGRFAPAPLLLAQTLGGYSYYGGGGNTLTQSFWRSKARKLIKKLDVVQVLFYSGNTYNEVVMSGYLNGGKGTFEVTSGIEGYSICARFVRARQTFNGYKFGGG